MDTHELKKLVLEILKSGHLISIASSDTGGLWVCDVIYTYDEDLNLYWISRAESRHSKAYVANPQAAGSITTVEKPEGKGKGIQIEGTVALLAQIPEDSLARYTQKRKGKEAWVPAEGEVWYKLTPTMMDIIYEPLFGFTKKKLTLV
jgi:uncharacterized protein YhbP (UPF0306 family)